MINRFIRKKMKVAGEVPPYVGYAPSSRETTLVEIFRDLDYKVGAEIGVQRAIFSRAMFETVPGLKLFLIDPWTPYRNAPTQHRQNRHQMIARANVKEFNAEFLVKTSKEALDDIPDGSLDFVYIDGLHDFDSVMFDIIEWSKKVRKDGIVSGHDFFHYHGVGVVYAVEAYVRAHGISQWYITKAYPSSWFWVKP
jgi:hypothetical protein